MKPPWKIRSKGGARRFPSLALFGLALLQLGCGRSRPDFGTLPQVEVPLEKRPAQDPTLFQEEEKEPPVTSDPPDPTPLRTKHLVDYHLKFNKGEIVILSVRRLTLDEPRSTPRKVGRFAFELWTGDELVERLRFDFPLLGAGAADEEDVIEGGLVTETRLAIPESARATSARILDRKTRKIIDIAWPPVEE